MWLPGTPASARHVPAATTPAAGTQPQTGTPPQGKPEHPRSPQWPGVEHAHLQRFPSCAICGTTQQLQVHHVLPVHLFPAKELDPANLMTLCVTPAQCHHAVGHLGDWLIYNPTLSGQV